MAEKYLVIGEIAEDHSGNTFLDSQLNWTDDFDKAYHFPNAILDIIPPKNVVGLMAVTNSEEFIPCQ